MNVKEKSGLIWIILGINASPKLNTADLWFYLLCFIIVGAGIWAFLYSGNK